MISILIPTRKRADSFRRFCKSVLDTASNPSDIEFIVYRDLDDNDKYEYPKNSKVITGERMFVERMINKLQTFATGDIYFPAMDDIVFETHGWDDEVNKKFDACEDKILLVHLNDHSSQPHYGTMAFLHKKWVDLVGYVYPPQLCRRGDIWIHDVAKKINRRVFLKDYYYRDFKILNDPTHTDYLALVEREKPREVYYSRPMAILRKKDAKKLRRYIDGFAHCNTG